MVNTEPELLHQEISQTLVNWAANNGVESDHIVQSLMQDLAGEENLAIWAGMDPFEYLPQPHPTLGFLFLVCALGMTGFPISTTFLGEDLLLSHVAEGDYGRAVVLSFTFVLNGIAVIRLYARIFLGHFSKSI
ncbi:MAG: hypothetical protein EBW17_07635, partial [Actinobacteria bacterium]|nr:hypothetical protein [Actinomycetota bacterium]